MSEFEIKLGVPDPALPSLREALRARGAKPVRLQARYFDTADGRLARLHMALRLRLEGRRWVQTAKAAGASSVERIEHEVAVPRPRHGEPAIDLQRHSGSEAAALLAQALQGAPAEALSQRYAIDVRRLRSLMRDGSGAEYEVALDEGHATAGERSTPIVELEIERRAGPPQAVFELASACIRHGGLWISSISKAQRAERLLLADTAPPPTGARRPRIDKTADGAAVMQAALHSTLEQVLANATDVCEGVSAAETVHQLRVGLRRLRTVLRELQALTPAIDPRWDATLRSVFQRLGQRRDQEVVAAAVRPLLQAAAAPRLAWRAHGGADPQQVVRESEFQQTLLAILALAHAGPERYASLSPDEARAAVRQRLEALHRKVTRQGRGFDTLQLEDQHRVRKQLKRLRYLADVTAALWPHEATQRHLKRLAAAQDALGRHNDIAVAAEAFRRDAHVHADAWFAAGYLEAHLAVTARRARKALRQIERSTAHWG